MTLLHLPVVKTFSEEETIMEQFEAVAFILANIHYRVWVSLFFHRKQLQVLLYWL